MTSDKKPEFAAQDFTMGQLNALVKKVGGRAAVEDLMRGDLKVIPAWHVWKEVTLGEFESGWKYIEAIRRVRKMQIAEYAYGALEKKDFPCSKTPEIAHLVLTTPCELGFRRDPTLSALYKRARQWGLQLCRQEVGPALRFEYTDQFPQERLNIATTTFLRYEESLNEEEADPFILMVNNSGSGAILSARSVRSDYKVDLDHQFVFEAIV